MVDGRTNTTPTACVLRAMAGSIFDLPRYTIVFLMVSIVAATVLADEVDTETVLEAIDRELGHAETYYWFGMAEQGNMAAFNKGMHHLDRVEKMVDELPSADLQQTYAPRITGLRTDLVEQIEIAHDTLYGVFPLTRFITQSLFAESTTLDTFEVIDDPTVMASTFAAKKLALETITEWKQRHQLDVVFTSVPHNTQLENEALYVFNSHPKFFVHNLREVTDALNARQLAEFQEGRVTAEIASRLMETFEVNDLLVVLVRRNDVVDDDYFYVLEGAIHNINTASGQPTHQFAVMGFSRDRNHWFTPIVITNILFLAVAFFAFWLHTKVRRRATVRISTAAFIVIPLFAFAVGRVVPWFVGPLLASISPIPETLAIVSFWVPAAAGLAITVLPMGAFWIAAKRLANFFPMFNLDARAVSVFIGIAAGAAAFLSVSLYLLLQDSALSVLVPTAIGMFGLAYVMGRALDNVDYIPKAVAVVPCVLALPLGAAVFQCSVNAVWYATCPIASACLILIIVDLKKHAVNLPTSSALPTVDDQSAVLVSADSAVDNERWAELAEQPRFQRLTAFDGCWKLLEPLLAGRTVHLGLFGYGGSGLTSLAGALAVDLAAAVKANGKAAVEMQGACPQPAGEPKPYAPFQKALAQHFEIELLAERRDTSEEIDAALGEVFQSVLPFAGVLFPTSSNRAGQPSSNEEISASIAWTLERIARRKSVVLMIDDSQWLDESSRGLLRHLIARFPAGGNIPIAIIVAAHDKSVFDQIGVAETDRFEMAFPTADEQVVILSDGIGLTPESAKIIVEKVGAFPIERGGLFWLLQIVSSLARGGAMVATQQGIELRDRKWPESALIPNELRDVLAEQLHQCPHYRTIIQCAVCACEGREFRASLVAEALSKSRMDLLIDLDRIDRETSILHDVRHVDDVFAFQSSFMMDVARAELQISPHGTDSVEVPQIVREHHGRLGIILERSLDRNPQNVYRVADHFHAGGSEHAGRGTKYCLDAARMACGILDFGTAGRYLKKAEHCASIVGLQAEVAAEKLYVECVQAHVTGQFADHAAAATAGASYLAAHEDPPTRLLLAIAQAHYDAGKSSGEQHWFEQSLEIGWRLLESGRSSRDQASGRHFVGISMPYDRIEERKSQLRQALEIIEAEPPDHESLELRGRILGALASELSYGSADEQREAATLFERRLNLIETHKVGDLRGQAMTHGGLGRLAFFGDSRDLAAAKFHFQKDLELSEAIGDQQGQIQMHSLLGACQLEEGEISEALEHYEKSWSLSRTTINQCFAAAGLLRCHVRRSAKQAFATTAKELRAAIGENRIPSACADDLIAALVSSPEDWRENEAAELLRMAGHEKSSE